ncbi:MAG: efflux RND transporter periplasmic adaptor subunit, partial [Candidatus Binatia bacterium]
VFAPNDGFVIQKSIVEGSAVRAGQQLYRLARMDRLWVIADVFESDLPHVQVGQEAKIRLPSVPGHEFEGTIDYIYPYLQDTTRTARARIELANPDLVLRPEMYAAVTILVDAGERLLVPKDAVLYTGPRRLVFVDVGEGRLRPQEIEVGRSDDDHYEVVDGLKVGDRVVTSGNFLVAAESRIRSAERFWDHADDAAE